VSPALFAAQMTRLREAGWRTITAAQLGADLATGSHPPPKSFVVTLDDGHVDGYTEALPILEANGFVATFFVVTHRIGRLGWLSDADVLAMAEAGMEIADHTMDHVSLPRLPLLFALAEIDGAIAWIANALGHPPVTFAYPFGSQDPSVVSDVAHGGFSIAFTNREGCFESTATRFLTPRLRVTPWMTPTALLDRLDACSYP